MGYHLIGYRGDFDNWIPSYTPAGTSTQDDPQFAEIWEPGVGGGDYHLAADSPANNATALHSHFIKEYDVDYNLRTPDLDGDDYGGYEWSQPPQSFKIKGITGVNGDITRTTTSD